MRLVSSAIVILAGAVMTTMPRGDYPIGFGVILIGFVFFLAAWRRDV